MFILNVYMIYIYLFLFYGSYLLTSPWPSRYRSSSFCEPLFNNHNCCRLYDAYWKQYNRLIIIVLYLRNLHVSRILSCVTMSQIFCQNHNFKQENKLENSTNKQIPYSNLEQCVCELLPRKYSCWSI